MNEETYPRIKDLPVEEQKPFTQWMNGQTMPLIEGLPMEEQDAYYPWDYSRWKQGLPVVD